MKAQPVCDPRGPSGRIVATIGPSDSPAYPDLEEMLGFGTVRINLAFARAETYEELRGLVRRIRSRRGEAVAVLLDCVGPRVKLGPLPREGVDLVPGAEWTLTTRDVPAGPGILPTVLPELPAAVRTGQSILLAEGRMRLDVLATDGVSEVRCRVTRGGRLTKRGINLPETHLPVPALSERDRRDLSELLGEDVDMVALSFVRGPADVEELRSFLAERGRPDVRIMAKIETHPAVQCIDEIAAVSDALMVARGDLWAELPNPWELPRCTMRIVRAGNARGIPVVTATQTLSSMVDRDTPSRAEVDELYFLLREGSDAIMGSEEFAIGRHPRAVAEAIRAVSREVDRERADLLREGRFPPREPIPGRIDRERAAVMWAEGTERVRCMVAISNLGPNAITACRERPRKPLVVVTNTSRTARYLQLFSVYGVLVDYRWEDENHAEIARAALRALGWTGRGETALLIVNHRATADRHYSKIEEIPLPEPE